MNAQNLNNTSTSSTNYPSPKQQQSQPGSNTSGQLSKKRSWVSNYYEYNLAELHDSHGGFLTPASSTVSGLDDPNASKRPKSSLSYLDALPALDADSAPSCVECNSTDLDPRLQDHFDVLVCWGCKEKFPEKYALLTKTEAKYDYMITDEELKDAILFPRVWRKKNPNKNTYHDMYLYLRMHVEGFAITKWGSLQSMDLEFERRRIDKIKRKDAVFKKKLAHLKNSTRTSIWADKLDKAPPHSHVFKPDPLLPGKLVCECGMRVDGHVVDDEDDLESD